MYATDAADTFVVGTNVISIAIISVNITDLLSMSDLL